MKILFDDKLNLENVNGITVIDTKELEEPEMMYYLKDLIIKVGRLDIIDVVVFGNKEYITEFSNINNIGFENIDLILTDCDTYAFIKLVTGETYVTGIQKRIMFDMGETN